MKSLFPHRLFSQDLFCCRCRSVTVHGIFAKEPYSTYGGLDPHIPLLCCCESCVSRFIAFSQEFSRGRRDDGAEYAKIYGHNRIAPGNWIYFKGTVKPGIVKSYFQTENKEVILVSYDGNTTEKVECPKTVIENEEAPEGYRLIPAQTAWVLMGDHVYHAIRDEFGMAVGLVSDGGRDKLAVQFRDKSILFITIPKSMQNLPNETLHEIVKTKLMQLFSEDARRISITVGQGIVYLDGIVRNLSVKRALSACINSIPRVRGCVNFTRVQVESLVSDERLEESILRLLETPGLKVFDYSVKVKECRAEVRCSCVSEYNPKDLENRIANFPGLQDLNFRMSVIPENSMENYSLCRNIESELAISPRLSGAVIRVNCVNGKYLLEGRVPGLFQRQWAMIVAKKDLVTVPVENRLRIC